MNKRSAVLIAAGLVLTLAIGGLAVSLGLTGPAPVDAAGPVRPERVVKVERRTVTIRRKAESPSANVVLSAPASDPSRGDDSDDGYDEDESEHESEHESESHEDPEEVESEDVG